MCYSTYKVIYCSLGYFYSKDIGRVFHRIGDKIIGQSIVVKAKLTLNIFLSLLFVEGLQM